MLSILKYVCENTVVKTFVRPKILGKRDYIVYGVSISIMATDTFFSSSKVFPQVLW